MLGAWAERCAHTSALHHRYSSWATVVTYRANRTPDKPPQIEDGNKRTSRLAANIPLMLYNCAPLSFLDVEVQDYVYAMLGVYEYGDVTLAAELFAWAYRRSIRKYAVQLNAAGVPDPVRFRFREKLNEAIGRVLHEQQTAEAATAMLGMSEDDVQLFRPILAQELRILDVYNCARYRLSMDLVQQWVEAGRPH